MQQSSIDNILKAFDDRKPVLEQFRTTCERLISQILDSDHLEVHSVTSRVKNRDKLKEKIERLGKQYEKLEDVTDIVGLRIITQFEDDVDRIGAVIEQEFHVHWDKSIDKRKALDPDRFGYLSLHYICALNESRSSLTEYKAYKGLSCEIQIRSILQHAWAEIEHDLGYKASSTIPAPVRRRFSRLAGLLELADAEFTHLRDELSQYKERVSEAIQQQFSDIAVDQVSIKAFVNSDSICSELDKILAKILGEELVDRDVSSDLVPFMQYVGLKMISDVHKALESRKKLIVEQLKDRVEVGIGVTVKSVGVSPGVSLYQLFQVMTAESGDATKIKEALDHFSIEHSDLRDRIAMQILSSVKKFSK